jgi:hypothetical protein
MLKPNYTIDVPPERSSLSLNLVFSDIDPVVVRTNLKRPKE